MPEELLSQFDVTITDCTLSNMGESSGEITQYDLLQHNALSNLSIFENMYEPALSGSAMVRDVSGWGEEIKLDSGDMYFSVTFETPNSVGDGSVSLCCEFKVYSVIPIDMSSSADAVVQARGYIINFSSISFLEGNERTEHLTIVADEEDNGEDVIPSDEPNYFKGKIHELLKKILDADALGIGYDIEETGNSVIYNPNQGAYPSLRKDDEQKPFEIIAQLTENAIHKDNPNAVNFHFWQDKTGTYNFKSIEQMLTDSDEPVAVYTGGVGSMGRENDKRRLLSVDVVRFSDKLYLKNTGALTSTMNYFRPRPDINKYKKWYAEHVDTVYFKVNCTMRDHFPAAIIGFDQRDAGIAFWKYAWAEVYLVFDIALGLPNFLIKPLSKGGLRSWIDYDTSEDFPEIGLVPYSVDGEFSGVNIYHKAAYNTLEQGNDGWSNRGDKVGWEAPGYRLDTDLWDENCMKIQPIRGSFCAEQAVGLPDEGEGEEGEGRDTIIKNNVTASWADCFDTTESLTTGMDNFLVEGYFPVVDMKIYYSGDTNEPYYFFTAANAVDGECGDESTEGEATGEVTGVPEVNPDGDIVVAGETTEDEDCKDEGETEARPRKIYPLEDLGFPEYEQGSAGPGPAGGNS